MWKYDVPPMMCRGTYVAINKLKSHTNDIKTDDAIHASIIAECIKIRDDTMSCETMNQYDANDIVMYLTTMLLNCHPQHDCTFDVLFTHLILLLYCYVRNKRYYYSYYIYGVLLSDVSICGHIWLCRTYLAGTGRRPTSSRNIKHILMIQRLN